MTGTLEQIEYAALIDFLDWVRDTGEGRFLMQDALTNRRADPYTVHAFMAYRVTDVLPFYAEHRVCRDKFAPLERVAAAARALPLEPHSHEHRALYDALAALDGEASGG